MMPYTIKQKKSKETYFEMKSKGKRLIGHGKDYDVYEDKEGDLYSWDGLYFLPLK